MFPGITVWFGQHTRRWWALTRDRSGTDRLIDAVSADELDRRLTKLSRNAHPERTAAAPTKAGLDGSWAIGPPRWTLR